ncbi:S-adenosyl-L-methionine-dependent methyltransferase, partial [Gilbertella persicaria]|uniref:S-adenosyl-L-methionine-dependent methyltransferase n=1 Tax=Gilbertella persicaria TaxID=101096 RepID=UPI0022208E90
MSSNCVDYSGAEYSKFRPTYNPEIYHFIFEFHAKHQGQNNLALDVGTGTGQVAIEICNTFKHVYAIDPLSEQINNAAARDNITYQVGSAEDLSQFQDHSIDMITAGTAFHWFDHAAFFKEAKRVLKKETGTLAVFGYFYPVIKNEPKATELIKALHTGDFEKYSNQNLRFIRNMYRDIEFPFKHQTWYITPPSEDVTHKSEVIDYSLMVISMSIEGLGHYMKTSSAYSNYMKDPENKGKEDPVDKLIQEIMQVMDIKDKKHIVELEWPTVLVLSKN